MLKPKCVHSNVYKLSDTFVQNTYTSDILNAILNELEKIIHEELF